MNTRKYWIKHNGQNRGPLSLEELKSCNLTPESIIWVVGTENWVRVSQLPEVLNAISGAAGIYDNSDGVDSPTQIGGVDSATQIAGVDSATQIAGVDSAMQIAGVDTTTFNTGSNVYGRTGGENNAPQVPGNKMVITISADTILSSLKNPLAAPCAGAFLTLVSLIVTIANISYASAGEFFMLLMMFFVVPGGMSGYSLYEAMNIKKYTESGDVKKALMGSGLSLGLGIGGIVCAIIGIIVAACGFDLL